MTAKINSYKEHHIESIFVQANLISWFAK